MRPAVLTEAGRARALELVAAGSHVGRVALYGAETGWPAEHVALAIRAANHEAEELERQAAALEPAAEPGAEPIACAECGHLHYEGALHGYSECPIEGCLCRGQAWRDEPAPDPEAEAIADELELRREAALIRRPGDRGRPGTATTTPGVRLVGGRRLYSSAWL